MAKATEYFCFFEDYYELAKAIPQKYRGDFFEAIAAYVFEGVEKDLKGIAKTIFEHSVKDRLKNTNAAKERQRRKRIKDSCHVTESATESVTVTPNVTGMSKEYRVKSKEEHLTVFKEKKEKRFTAPSKTELETYIRDNGYSVNAARFLAYYDSKGWKVGNAPMKSWQAAVRTWHYKEEENESGHPAPALKVVEPNPFDYLNEKRA